VKCDGAHPSRKPPWPPPPSLTPHPLPPRSAPQTAIDFAIHPAEILASERARHPDLLLPVEEGVEASMKRQG